MKNVIGGNAKLKFSNFVSVWLITQQDRYCRLKLQDRKINQGPKLIDVFDMEHIFGIQACIG